MTSDAYHIAVSSHSEFMNFEDPDSTHPVGASHLRDYLEVMYGPEVPADPRARFAAHQLLDNLAVLSLDESRVTIEPLRYVPRFLQLIEPVASGAKTLGQIVDHQLTGYEKSTPSLAYKNDLTYCIGVFDMTVPVLAQELAVPLPKRVSDDRSREVLSLIPGLAAEHDLAKNAEALEFLMQLPHIKAEHRRKLARMQELVRKLTVRRTEHMDRLRNIMPDIAFEGLPVTTEEA
ncbi:hypothetical protein BH09PAT3_BH09PAT3_5790 [soil metagenome]